MKRLLVLLQFLLLSVIASAQAREITGRVTDDTGAPLTGASVIPKGAKTGAQTDAAGNFKLSVNTSGDITLSISFTGYSVKTVTTNGAEPITIQLVKLSSTLEDVVVVGYSSIRRKDMTGSVSSVNAKQMKDIPIASAAEAIQGRLAGVQATASEGAPGAEVIVKVRGGSSITQDNQPLYIVDGVPVENALQVISPQDIASIDVLKDASTTAIYGARAANGVMIITTKGGKLGKTTVTYNGAFGFRQLPQTVDVMNPYDFVLWQYERSRGVAADSSSFAQTYGTTWDTLQNYKNVPMVNWQEEVFGRKANFQNHNISVNGGSDKTSFNLSVTKNIEEGIQLESGFDRNLVNFKLDHKISDKFKMGITFRYIDQEIQGSGTTNTGTRATNRLRHAINYRPFELDKPGYGVDDFDEAYYLASGGAVNPVLMTEAEYRRQYTKGTYLVGYLNYNITKNLTFRSTFGYDNVNIQTNQFYSKITSNARNSASLPLASIGNQLNNTITNSNTLQYNVNNYKGKHDFSVLLGQELIDQRSEQAMVETRYFPADISAEKALANMGLGSAPTGSQQPLPTTFIAPPARILSFFGRATYAYDDKYLATFNLRADRSSKFSSENGTLVFPSGSLAWRFSKEGFMSGIDWLTDGKIRAGYGEVGNNRIDNLLYMQLYGVTGQYAFNHSIVPGFAPSALANPNLQWEKSVTRNIGLDLGFFNNRLQLSVDLYKNSGKDLLLAVAIPPTTGYSSQIQNLGSTTNSGVEFQINATPVIGKNFIWNTSFNLSFNQNTVESLGGITQLERNSGWQGSDGVNDYLVKVGQPVGLMYGFVTDGLYKIDDFNYDATSRAYTLKSGIASNGVYGVPQPGMLKWKDLNGDGLITADSDRTVIGNANPKFIGGWNNQFSYRGFDLSVFVNWVYGNDIYNANKLEWTDGAYPNLNTLNIMKDRWTNIDGSGNVVTSPKELGDLNANANIWSPVRVQRWWLHSWAVEDGSYLRVNNVTLGYTLPTTLTSKVKISTVRFYGTVNNLATLTSYSGYDPDVSARRTDPLTPGVDFAAYPRARTWLVGLNLTF